MHWVYGPVFDEEEVGMSWTKFLNHNKSYHPKHKFINYTYIQMRLVQGIRIHSSPSAPLTPTNNTLLIEIYS